jgi:arylsulfatase A-like enzyme
MKHAIRLTLTWAASLVLPLLAQSQKPNIIFIMADDMGYADAGCYGGKHIRTPNIDGLARDGLRFTQCYAGHEVCAPSRNVLMTGLHSGHTTVRGNFGVTGGVVGLGGGEHRIPLRAEDVTVAEVLKKAGYVTGITGKWGLGEPATTGPPNKQGFDEWFGYLNQRRAHTYYPTFIWLNQHKFLLTGNQDGAQTQYTHDLFTGFALHFLRRYERQPFFLYVPYTIPHAAFEVPSLGAYAGKDWPDEEKAYAAMITRMDTDIGRIMNLLTELNLEDNTIVFFCSDNGAQNRYDHLFNSAGPFRGKKGTLYEGGIRTPMIVRWPGRVPAGQTSDAVWYFADFLPTAAEIAGLQPPGNIDGVSVLPVLLGQEREIPDRFLYWESPSRGLRQAVRWRDWKAVRLEQGAPLELYDLVTDIGEKNNVAAQHPDIVRKLEEYLKTARTESKEWPVRE